MFTPKAISSLYKSILAVGILSLTGCGGDDSPSAPTVTPTGPADASAFAGTTIEINPTINFYAGGTITYYNVVASTILPVATVPVAGTYIYTPSADLLSGTLTLTMPSIDRSITFTLTAFKQQNGKITSFTATASGQNYSGQVTSGTLNPGTTSTTSGGSTNSGGTNTGGSSNTGGTNTGGSTSGSGTELVYSTSIANGPYTNGQKVAFTFTRNATDETKSTLQFSSKTLTTPTYNASSAPYFIYRFTDTAAGLVYETVIKDGAIYEINVMAGTDFKGQFAPTSSGTTGGSSGGSSLPAGALAAGTTFTRTVATKIVAPVGSAVPADVPNYTTGLAVTFTVNSAGNLTFSGLSVPFSADSGTSVSYIQVLSPGNSNTVIVYKNLTTGAPAGVAIQFVRTSGTLPPVVTMVDYTLN